MCKPRLYTLNSAPAARASLQPAFCFNRYSLKQGVCQAKASLKHGNMVVFLWRTLNSSSNGGIDLFCEHLLTNAVKWISKSIIVIDYNILIGDIGQKQPFHKAPHHQATITIRWQDKKSSLTYCRFNSSFTTTITGRFVLLSLPQWHLTVKQPVINSKPINTPLSFSMAGSHT